MTGSLRYTMPCKCIHQQMYGGINDEWPTALMTKGTILSTSATPPRTLFFPDIAYIRSVVNTGGSLQRILLYRVTYTHWQAQGDLGGHITVKSIFVHFGLCRPVRPSPLSLSSLLLTLIITCLHSISSILNSRFLLALHETNARLVGANRSISSLSIDINDGDDQRAGSPELPQFLGAIGGPIHSFHDEDEDLRSLTFGPPQEEEHEAELEGEIQEIGRDGGNTV